MHSVIDRLNADHASMTSLLDILERELGKVEQTEIANFEVMNDVMHYLTHYSDAVHHPMEDLVYACLSDRSPKAREKLAPIPVEHTRIEEESRALREAVSMIADGGMALRSELVTTGKVYIADLRRHIELEELHLFPLAREILDDSDLEEVARILNERKDPVFGDVVEDDFRNLYEHIHGEG